MKTNNKGYPRLVVNVRINPDNMRLEEFPIFCCWGLDDYEAVVMGDEFDYTLCPVGSYNSIVTIH